MGFTLLKLPSSCISEIIMVLLRIISGISLLPSLIGFLCAYCISPGYPMDGPLDHYHAYELWLALSPCPGFYSLCGLLGFPGTPRALRDNGPLPLLFYGFCGTYGPFPPWYSTGYDSNWAIRPFHGANLILETLGDAF